MEPMTLDEAKENARCYRDDPSAYCSDTERTAAALLTALEAAEQRVATVRADAFEEAAKVADGVAHRAPAASMEGTARIIARDIRALAARPDAPEANLARRDRAVAVAHDLDTTAEHIRALAPKSPAPEAKAEAPFDARKAVEAGQQFLRDRFPLPVPLGSANLLAMLDAMRAAGSKP